MKANGDTIKSIAKKLGIYPGNVQELLCRAYRNLGASNDVQAIAVALKLEVITPDDIEIPHQLALHLAMTKGR